MKLCSWPFSFKVLWSPFVEFFYIKEIGKRKTWIIASSAVMIVILLYLRANMEELLIA